MKTIIVEQLSEKEANKLKDFIFKDLKAGSVQIVDYDRTRIIKEPRIGINDLVQLGKEEDFWK